MCESSCTSAVRRVFLIFLFITQMCVSGVCVCVTLWDEVILQSSDKKCKKFNNNFISIYSSSSHVWMKSRVVSSGRMSCVQQRLTVVYFHPLDCCQACTHSVLMSYKLYLSGVCRYFLNSKLVSIFSVTVRSNRYDFFTLKVYSHWGFDTMLGCEKCNDMSWY